MDYKKVIEQLEYQNKTFAAYESKTLSDTLDNAATAIGDLLSEREALLKSQKVNIGQQRFNLFHTQCTDCYCKDQTDYIRIALAIETLKYHDKNFLWTGDDCKISEVMQYLLINALTQTDERRS